MFNVELPSPWICWSMVAILLIAIVYQYRGKLMTVNNTEHGTRSRRRKCEPSDDNPMSVIWTVSVCVGMILWGAYLVFKIPNPPYWPALITFVCAVIFWVCMLFNEDDDLDCNSLRVTVMTVVATAAIVIMVTLLWADAWHDFVLWTAVLSLLAGAIPLWKMNRGWSYVLFALLVVVLMAGSWYAMTVQVIHSSATFCFELIAIIVLAISLAIFIGVGKETEEKLQAFSEAMFFMPLATTGIILLFNSTAIGLIWLCVASVLIAGHAKIVK